jgi:acetylornithine deacetylase
MPVQTSDSSTLKLIERLIGFNTVSKESNLGLIEWARDYLRGFGIDCRLSYDADKRKANLFATIGDRTGGGLVLSGHTDVVPVVGQDWDTDPFVATVKDGKIFGRGTCDMKSFIAVCLAKVPVLAHANLPSPVHFAFSYDEEVGCLGVRGLLDDLAKNDIRPAGCIVGEPTNMEVVVAHKGKRSYHCCVRGREAHSSMTPIGVNAIEFAADLIGYIRDVGERIKHSDTYPGFDVPFSTVLTTAIKGGMSFHNTNTIPRDCEFVFEHRFLPGVDPEHLINEVKEYASSTLLPQMRVVAPEADINFSTKVSYPGLDQNEASAISQLTQRLSGQTKTRKVAFGTEAGLFQQAGIPSIICGPGNIAQAHKPNEYVTVEQIAQCERFIDQLVTQLKTFP